MSGRGTVYSFSIMHMSGGPGFDSGAPYAVAVIELEEQAGLRTVGNVLRCDPQEIYCGMPVMVTFEEVGNGATLPQWHPAGESS